MEISLRFRESVLTPNNSYFMKQLLSITFLITLAFPVFGQETYNLTFYNVLNYPTAPPDNREVILADILAELQPDIFMICELESEAAGIDILENSLQVNNAQFTIAPYFNNTSSNADLQQLLYYDASKFELVTTDIIETSVRDINRYRLKILASTETPLFIELFVSHLKASTGAQNEQLRLAMVEEFTDYLDTLNPDDYVVFAGDLNLYSSNEPAYQELLNTSNSIVLKDPIDSPGNWNNNSQFENIHSQSTRISNNEFDDFGAGGGLDSRFDFILLSENLVNAASDIAYVTDSYKTVGNNGNCFNNRLDDSDCSGTYSSDLRDLLYNMSDHLPIQLQLEVSADVLNIESFEDETPLAWFMRSTYVDNEVEIAFAKANIYPQKVQIIDQLGRILKVITLNNDTTALRIDISDLSQGSYFVNSSSHLPTLRFIKR